MRTILFSYQGILLNVKIATKVCNCVSGAKQKLRELTFYCLRINLVSELKSDSDGKGLDEIRLERSACLGIIVVNRHGLITVSQAGADGSGTCHEVLDPKTWVDHRAAFEVARCINREAITCIEVGIRREGLVQKEVAHIRKNRNVKISAVGIQGHTATDKPIRIELGPCDQVEVQSTRVFVAGNQHGKLGNHGESGVFVAHPEPSFLGMKVAGRECEHQQNESKRQNGELSHFPIIISVTKLGKSKAFGKTEMCISLI